MTAPSPDLPRGALRLDLLIRHSIVLAAGLGARGIMPAPPPLQLIQACLAADMQRDGLRRSIAIEPTGAFEDYVMALALADFGAAPVIVGDEGPELFMPAARRVVSLYRRIWRRLFGARP